MMHDDLQVVTLERCEWCALLLAILMIGFIGTLAELFLLEQDEDTWQLIPIALLSAGTLAVTWTAVGPSALAWRVFRGLMVLFVAAAGLGLFFHYRANVEFQRETDPSLASTALFSKVMAAKAPPARPLDISLTRVPAESGPLAAARVTHGGLPGGRTRAGARIDPDSLWTRHARLVGRPYICVFDVAT